MVFKKFKFIKITKARCVGKTKFHIDAVQWPTIHKLDKNDEACFLMSSRYLIGKQLVTNIFKLNL
jgi:hypothetical protein